MANEEKAVPRETAAKKFVVRRAFGYKGVYYTNANIHTAPKEVVEKYLKSGGIEEVPGAAPKAE